MTFEQIGTLFAILLSLTSLFSTLFVLVTRIAKIEVKVDTMWDFQLRRGLVEIVAKGAGSVNSPVIIHDHAKHWCDSMKNDLRTWYEQSVNKPETDRQLAIEIERMFGERILTEICLPNNIDHGACLLIAVAVAKGEPTIDLLTAADKPVSLDK